VPQDRGGRVTRGDYPPVPLLPEVPLLPDAPLPPEAPLLPDVPLLPLPDDPLFADELLPEPEPALPIELEALLPEEPALDRLLAFPADAVFMPEPERLDVAVEPDSYLDEMPSAAIVDESSWPVACRLLALWNLRSAVWVCGPITPSAEPALNPLSLSACCTDRTNEGSFVFAIPLDDPPIELMLDDPPIELMLDPELAERPPLELPDALEPVVFEPLP